MARVGVSNYVGGVLDPCRPQHVPHVSHSGMRRPVSRLDIWTAGLLRAALLTAISQIPIASWLAALVKLAYDRELSILERSVKPADILHNSSLILGKQIVHILPEGWVDTIK